MRRELTIIVGCIATLAGVTACGGDPEAPFRGDTEEEIRAAKATLHVPILERVKVGRRYERRLIAKRNAEIRGAGLEEFPEVVVLDRTTGSAPFMALYERTAEVERRLHLEDGIEMLAFGDGSELEGKFGAKKEGICYTGSPKEAVGLLSWFTDSVFSDQFTLHAWKYKTRAYDAAGSSFQGSDMAEFESEFPEIWHEWRGRGEAILFLSSVSDGGEEHTPTILRKCKP